MRQISTKRDTPRQSGVAMTTKRIVTPDQFNKQLTQEFAVWTINDQQRLLALDALHDRMLSYHNNIHVKDSKLEHAGDLAMQKDENTFSPTSIVAQVMQFGLNANGRPHPLSYENLAGFVKELQVGMNSSQEDHNSSIHAFTWLHLRDPMIMEIIAPDLKIHELVAAGFQDYRAHSNVLPGNSEMLLSFVTSVLESNDCNMYKLFIYVSHNLVITYQVELLPDLTNLELSNPDKIVQTLLSSHSKLSEKCAMLGPIYLVYELALRVLRMSDSSLEFISCALSYFNRIVHLNLLHRERLEIRIKMDMISSGVLLMRRSVDEIKGICHHLLTLALDMEDHRRFYYHQQINKSHLNSEDSVKNTMNNSMNSANSYVGESKSDKAERLATNKLAKYTSAFMRSYTKYEINSLDHSTVSMHSDLKRILYGDLVAIKHIPYLMDILDAYTFIHTCLNTEFEETVRLQAELDGTIQLRTTNTSTVLSLIATLFLPLTFLAGVFGMNFQEDGGYSIALLNYKHGPMVFTAMCLCKP
ncbi:hypothetical protein EON65_38205 [archaeon]|nr:MAG: hypothetical protein EON65_38205 [archaeon]